MPLPKYTAAVSTRQTPANQPIPGSSQVPNNTGGFGWELDKWKQLDRFLILGAEGGTYYVTEQKLIADNAKSLIACIKEDPTRTINRIVEVSDSGRAFKNDPAIFALALVCSQGTPEAKKIAYAAIPKVCRIGTHLFHFAAYINDLRGWGSGIRKAVAEWYRSKEPQALSYQIIKYGQRDGWSHKDILALAHPRALSPEQDAIFRYIVGGKEALTERQVKRGKGSDAKVRTYKDVSASLPPLITAFDNLSEKSSVGEVLKALEDYDLPHESLPTSVKNKPEIWEALLNKGMPLMALVRNLANMTRIGTLAPMNANVGLVVKAITDEAALKKARIHPLGLLLALKTYSQGHGEKGTNTWAPIPQVIDALDEAFYKAFKFIEPTGKNIMLALDISGSMGSPCSGVPIISCREGVAVMAMATAKSEKNYFFFGFSDRFIPLNISSKQRLDDVTKYINSMPFGSTNCGLPMTYATDNNLHIDIFQVYTDNEMNTGNIHPCQALKRYRERVNPNARLAVIGMAANKISIADPNDSGMMDLVGFDANAPALLSQFANGTI